MLARSFEMLRAAISKERSRTTKKMRAFHFVATCKWTHALILLFLQHAYLPAGVKNNRHLWEHVNQSIHPLSISPLCQIIAKTI